MSAPISFSDVVMRCWDDADFMTEYRRLTGSTLGAPRSPVDRLVDDATGRGDADEQEALAFFAFVRDVIWDRLPPEAFVVQGESR